MTFLNDLRVSILSLGSLQKFFLTFRVLDPLIDSIQFFILLLSFSFRTSVVVDRDSPFESWFLPVDLLHLFREFFLLVLGSSSCS